jgi:integrase
MVLHIPIGDETATVRVGDAGVVKASLRTHNPREAKERQAKALAYLDDVWRSLREGPRRMTHREVFALAGDWYRWAKERWEDDPGRATMWGILQHAASRWDADTIQREMAPYVDQALTERALNVDNESRKRLAVAMHGAVRDAAALLKRRAEGDYGPDAHKDRFPEWRPDAARPSVVVDVMTLFEGWERESRAAGVTEKTINEYRSVLRRFVAFLGHNDATRITPHDVVAWKDKRITDGRSPKTVKDVDLSAMRSVFGWAAGNHKLATNPAAGVTVKIGKQARGRGKGFTDDEALTILRAALRYAPAGRENAKTAGAKRWLPWLCAYTGARIGEVAQLRREDVYREADHWVVKITPEAGPVKNKEAREVPLHPHLVELGFPDFVRRSGEGYLFLTATKASEMQGRLRALKNRLTHFARGLVPDKRVAPNHGWRHRFITKSRLHGLDTEKRRMITGHAGEGVDEKVYGDRAGLYREICKLPHYAVTSEESPSVTAD